MKKMQLSSKPPKANQDPFIEEKLKEFVLGAELNKNNEQSTFSRPVIKEKDYQEKTTFPWQESGIRKDVHKLFNLRLPEEYYVKLAYLSQMTKDSKHKICLDILLSEIDKKLNLR
jgi:hypothetical protein